MSAKQQIELLANYIMENVPGEPGRSEGAGDTAMRLLKRYRETLTEIAYVLNAPNEFGSDLVTTARAIAMETLGDEQ